MNGIRDTDKTVLYQTEDPSSAISRTPDPVVLLVVSMHALRQILRSHSVTTASSINLVLSGSIKLACIDILTLWLIDGSRWVGEKRAYRHVYGSF
jgi:hypothetical protein